MASNSFHILVVEDDPNHADLLMMGLRAAGAKEDIHHCLDGCDAYDYVRKQGKHKEVARPNLILLDLNLPGLHGLEVLARIKGDEALASIPVVILSTSADEADMARAYASHANSYLVKPVDFDEYMKMASDLLKYWRGWNRELVTAGGTQKAGEDSSSASRSAA